MAAAVAALPPTSRPRRENPPSSWRFSASRSFFLVISTPLVVDSGAVRACEFPVAVDGRQ
jgi:hypothetical protein